MTRESPGLRRNHEVDEGRFFDVDSSRSLHSDTEQDVWMPTEFLSRSGDAECRLLFQVIDTLVVIVRPVRPSWAPFALGSST
jgi:hypothetical protein